MLRKIEIGAWIAGALLFGIFVLGFAVPSIRRFTFWAMTPGVLVLVAAFVLGKVNRMRALAASARSQFAEAQQHGQPQQ